MNAEDYKRWALDGLRERAKTQGIPVTGRKNEPRLLLWRCDDLSISYQEQWWRSAFKRSGYGGALSFQNEEGPPDSSPAIVLLINLVDFFVPIRSPECVEEIDHFIGRLVQLADWCVSEKLAEFRQLASAPGTALSKAEQAAKELREFPFRVSSF